MIGVLDKSFSILSPISFKVAFNLSSLRPATPHAKPSRILTPSSTVYLPATNIHNENHMLEKKKKRKKNRIFFRH